MQCFIFKALYGRKVGNLIYYYLLVKVRFIAVGIDRSALTLLRNVREVPSEL